MDDEKPVLLVEDNPDDEFLSLRALKKCNIDKVVVARDGAEALDYLFGRGPYAGLDATVPPSLILLDLKLPKVDGIELLQAIRAVDRTKDIPVIITSSSREESDVKRCSKLGVRFFLNKPLKREEVTEVAKELGIDHHT